MIEVTEPAEGYLDHRVNTRWSEAGLAGWQPVPDVLLRHQGELKVSATELNVLLNITTHWWAPGEKPFPRSATIAKRMNVEPRTVQRAIRSLAGKGLLKIERREEAGGRCFDLTPLVTKLAPLGRAEQHRRAQNKAAGLVDKGHPG